MNVWEGLDAAAEAQKFRDLWGIEGTVLLDEAGTFVDKMQVRGVPTNIFVSETGVVTAVGASRPEDLESQVQALLGPDVRLPPAGSTPDGWHWQQEPDYIGQHITSRSQSPEP